MWDVHRDIKTSNADGPHRLRWLSVILGSRGGSGTVEPMTTNVVTLGTHPELLLGATSYSTAVDDWSVRVRASASAPEAARA